jgi:inhibitor of cysteine peptidase
MDSGDAPPHRPVVLNKPFEITLEANPTTGYRWEAAFDSSFLRLQDRSFKRGESAQKGMVGVGGKTTFIFVPVKVGQAIINFQYKRPWEAEAIKEVSTIVVITR